MSIARCMMTLLYVVAVLAVLIFWVSVVVLAAVGRSFGVTQLYIRMLLFIFEVNSCVLLRPVILFDF